MSKEPMTPNEEFRANLIAFGEGQVGPEKDADYAVVKFPAFAIARRRTTHDRQPDGFDRDAYVACVHPGWLNP